MQKFLHVPVYITMITFCMVMFIASAFAFDVLEKPGNYNDINTIVETLIPDYYEDDEKVQCGGWDFEDTVAPIDPLSRNPLLYLSKIPAVTGLPGHQIYSVFGNPKSGMAVRNEAFVAPGNAANNVQTCGYMSACRTGGSTSGSRFRPPFYNFFPCQRPLGDIICSDDADIPQRPPDRDDGGDSGCGPVICEDADSREEEEEEEEEENKRPPGRIVKSGPEEGEEGKIEFTCGGEEMPADGMVCGAGLLESAMDGGLCGLLNNNWLYGYYQKKVAMNEHCNDARNGGSPTLVNCKQTCELTRYYDRTACRVLKGFDDACSPETPEDEIKRVDSKNGAIPKDPHGEDMEFVEPRFCCTRQAYYSPINGPTSPTLYGPEGRGDPTGDSVNQMFLKNCEVCEDSECRFPDFVLDDAGKRTWPENDQPEPPRPRYQYYPPWKTEIYSAGCEVCRDKDGDIVDCCSDLVETSGEWPCEKYLTKFDPDIPNFPSVGMKPGWYRRRKNDYDDLSFFHYRSFFRHYTGAYRRSKVAMVPTDDNAKWDIPVSCYGLYEELDPFDEVVKNRYKPCVIAAYYFQAEPEEEGEEGEETPHRNFGTMSTTQVGKGNYYREMGDIDAMVRNTAFDEDTDMWYPGIGNAFSLSNSEILKEKYNNDITMLLTQPTDEAHLESSIQLKEEGIRGKTTLRSSGALLRSFDDTVHISRGDERTMAQWWQAQQTQMHTLLNPAVVRLLLPPAWSVGLDPFDPLFTPRIVDDPTGGGTPQDPRMQAMEVQLEASEDLIDVIKAFLRRSLLPTFEEQPIPILVPSGSPTEFRALSERWRAWAKGLADPEKTPPANLADIETKVADLALMLEYYAHQIEGVRTLRTELAYFNQRFFDDQKVITETIASWLGDDLISGYEGYRHSLVFLEVIRPAWEGTQKTYRKFHDKTCMPWCHNERYSLPIYSLLDTNRFSGRPAVDGGDWRNNPNAEDPTKILPSISVDRGFDLSFDFTALKPAEGVINIPVVQPIQVPISLKLLEPPGTSSPSTWEVPLLPDFPSFPSISEIIKDYEEDFAKDPDNEGMGGGIYPEVIVDPENVPVIDITYPDFSSLTLDLTSIGQMDTVIKKLNYEYARFWESQTLFSYEIQPDKYTEQDCYKLHEETCVHAEMDLLERLMRFGTRPAVILREDHLSIGWFRPNPADVGYDMASCPDNDWTCQLLNEGKTYPATGWSVDWPAENESKIIEESICAGASKDMSFIDQLRVCGLRSTVEPHTLPEDLEDQGDPGDFPYNTPRNQIVPSFEVPPDLDFIPDYEITIDGE